MTKREEFFYQNLIIIEADKSRAANALKSKGLEKHILIKERLLNWGNNSDISDNINIVNGNDIEYSKIASTYRYDKRIRAVLFKYISYLEEFYRGIILDNYINRVKQNFWIEEFQRKLMEYDNNLNETLEQIDFRVLLIQCQKLPRRKKALCGFPKSKNLKENSIALKELRNAVMHNKFLLLYRGFDECYVSGVDSGKGTSLKANILNLIQFLPFDVGLKCKKEINDCKKNRNDSNDTAWDLPSQIIISL